MAEHPTARLDHVGLSVADLAAAEAWYCDAFGYVRELALRVDPIDLDIVMLIHPEHGDRLELLHRPGLRRRGCVRPIPAEAALSRGVRAHRLRRRGTSTRPSTASSPSAPDR